MSLYSTFAPDAFSGKTVMITGAASGMGLEAARAFAAKQAEVLMCDINASTLDSAAKDIRSAGGTVHALEMDVADQSSVDAAFASCDELLDSLDVLITCAAIGSTARIPDQDRALWRHVMEVNLLGTFFCAQAAIARMKKQESGGNILCIASDAGVNGGGGLVVDTAYAASKAGTLSLVKSIARELSGGNIRINALNPGPTDSPFMAKIGDELKGRIAGSLPVRRMGKPSDMAAAMLYICSDDAPFLYGNAVDVNGGSIFR
ncbi:SDR family NAD(P)-dependent oxidoreductase [Pseudoruegeria sp. HB172150]|uniref:SDR family NAD(P)-dependent oxidoreductase n=1 Tax=Pseudoruegeria sp. HB172150 TaxID=2721164 RepID=UPI001C130784|nr:SDR family oxidoreductase [Pseudoruegeria sp. HB172150]